MRNEQQNKRCFVFQPASLMMWGISTCSKLTESRLTSRRDLTENWKIWQAFISHISNTRKPRKMFRIPTFVPDDVMNLSVLKAHRKQTDISSRPHLKLTNKTIIQFSYLHHAKQIKCASNFAIRPRCCEESQLTQSSPNADWHLIETSPNILKCDSHSVLIL